MVKAAGHATLEVINLLEERVELLALVHHHLAVLHRRAVEQVVQLHGLVRGGALLVLAAIEAEPEEHVLVELVALGVLGRLQHDVRVALVEVAVLRLRPSLHLERFNPPDLHTRLLPGALPRRLGLCGALARLLVLRAANLGAVAVLDVERECLLHGAPAHERVAGRHGKRWSAQAMLDTHVTNRAGGASRPSVFTRRLPHKQNSVLSP